MNYILYILYVIPVICTKCPNWGRLTEFTETYFQEESQPSEQLQTCKTLKSPTNSCISTHHTNHDPHCSFFHHDQHENKKLFIKQDRTFDENFSLCTFNRNTDNLNQYPTPFQIQNGNLGSNPQFEIRSDDSFLSDMGMHSNVLMPGENVESSYTLDPVMPLDESSLEKPILSLRETNKYHGTPDKVQELMES